MWWRLFRSALVSQSPPIGEFSARDRGWLLGVLLIIVTGYLPLIGKVGTYGLDSGVYLAGAHGLVDGKGYCFSFFERAPKIGIYPPLQSAWLALWWRIGGTFPENIPWLNAGMLILGLATAAISFVLWRRLGMARGVAVVLTLAWAFNPMWITWLAGFMSDPGFTVACLLAMLIWIHPGLQNSRWIWALTGCILGLAYLWRAAALAPLVALGGIAALQVRRKNWLPIFAYGLPSFGAVVGWNWASPHASGYTDVLSRYVSMSGGVWKIPQLLFYNFIYCVKGIPFFEMMVPAIARIPQWLHFGTLLRTIYEIIEGGLFWTLTYQATRGFRRQTTALDWTVLILGGAYLFEISVMPFQAEHFQRYLFVLYPFYVLWIWRSLASADTVWMRRGLIVLVAGTLVTNTFLAIVIHRRQFDRELVVEFRDLTSWFNLQVPSGLSVAMNTTLPVAYWNAQTQRPIVVDYFNAKWMAGSPITHASQGFPRADYVLMEGIDERIKSRPSLFTEVFRTAQGHYCVLKVDPLGERQFRRENGIPEPR